MTRLTMVVSGIALVTVGAALGWLLVKMRVLPGFTSFQVPGDAPVTVSDGSLHAHSDYGWVKNNDGDPVIQPNPDTGTLQATCTITDKNGKKVSAIFWRDDILNDITPATDQGLKITITHDQGTLNSDEAAVVIAVPRKPGPLTITSNKDGFDKGKGNKYNRQHSRPGEVAHIKVEGAVGGTIDWDPYNKAHPHFTLAFCYKK